MSLSKHQHYHYNRTDQLGPNLLSKECAPEPSNCSVPPLLSSLADDAAAVPPGPDTSTATGTSSAFDRRLIFQRESEEYGTARCNEPGLDNAYEHDKQVDCGGTEAVTKHHHHHHHHYHDIGHAVTAKEVSHYT
jgi:hypothetical protein